MKKTGKRFISAFLAIIMVASLFITGVGCSGDDETTTSSSSSTTTSEIKTLDQINSFDKSVQLIYAQYTTLKNGSISVLQKSGRWFYRFTYAPGNGDPKTYRLDVLASAFMDTARNQNDPRVNKKLEDIMRTDSNSFVTDDYFYKRSYFLADSETYVTVIARMILYAKRDVKKCTIQTKLGGELRFEWHDYTNGGSQNQNYYKINLTRIVSTQTGKAQNPSLYYMPDIDFRLKNTGYESGSNVPLLSNYNYEAKGTEFSGGTIKAESYYEAGVTLTKALVFKDTLSYIDLATTVSNGLHKENGVYSNSGVIPLTVYSDANRTKAKKASLSLRFKSPIALHVATDQYTINIELTNVPLNNTEFDIYYSIAGSTSAYKSLNLIK